MTNPMLAPSSAPVLLSPFYDGDHRMVHHAPLADGRTIVVWAGTGSAAEGYDIFAQFLDETGAPVGTPFVVNSYLISDQIMPQVTALPGGGFVVAWQSFAQDDFSITDPYDSQFTLQYGIYCQTFDAAGAPVGGETLVNENTVGHQFKPKMLTLDDGGYIVFWGELRVTYFQRFDADGNKVGTATMVPAIEEDGSSFLFGPWGESNFVQLDDGNIAVFWTKTTQTASHVTIFDLDGVLVNEFDVGVGSQTMMVQLENGNLFLAWTSQMDGIVGSGEATHMIGAVYTPAGEVVVLACPHRVVRFDC
ncbi:hypothetical protein [Marivivens marinus]|uniref:hypothetical protein n=1 Tax=Marivivens marinus TaxID=3110173 RepID=UPI003B8471C2